MSKRDYYEILELNREADDDLIKKSYRRLAMKYHPDRNPGNLEAEHHFKEAKEAYEILSDPQKRQLYDQFGHDGLAQGMGAAHRGGVGDIFDTIFGDFGDIFGSRSGGRGQRTERGSDLRYDLDLSLEQAVFGTQTKIEIPILMQCEDCKGSGAKAGSSPSTCQDCQGNGQLRMQRGFFTVQQTCPRCHGQGQVINDPCQPCRGQGRKQQKKTLELTIPAGVDEGDQIRMSGEGEAGGRGGPPGDLYVLIHLKAHEVFKRQENNLYCEVPISFQEAALGGELEIPTLSGHVKLKIPAETQSGKLFRLRGRGVQPVRGHNAGDLLCRVVVETPVNLDKKQKELLKKFSETLNVNNEKHTPRYKSWFHSVKKFFEGNKS